MEFERAMAILTGKPMIDQAQNELPQIADLLAEYHNELEGWKSIAQLVDKQHNDLLAAKAELRETRHKLDAALRDMSAMALISDEACRYCQSYDLKLDDSPCYECMTGKKNCFQWHWIENE